MGNLGSKSYAPSCVDSSKLGPYLTSVTTTDSERVRSSSHESHVASPVRVLPVGQGLTNRTHSTSLEDNVLVWFTDSENTRKSDLQCLRRKVRSFRLFHDIDQLVAFSRAPENKSLVLVVSYGLDQQVVPLVHPILQFNSIFILGRKRSIDHDYQKLFPKVRGFFSSMEAILKWIRSQEDLLPIERLLVSSILIRDLLNQILLVELHYHADSKQDLIVLARQSYPEQSSVIDEFERDYTPAKAIWWLTRKCFLYSIINNAYRTMDLSQLIKIGFFLRDVNRQIERADHGTDTPRKSRVYCGQGLNKTELDLLQAHPSDLFSAKHLLWTTTTDPTHALFDARMARNHSHDYGIVFRVQFNGSMPLLSSEKASCSSEVVMGRPT